MSMIEVVITFTLGALAMCYLLRALHRSGQVGPDGQELPDEVIWGFRDYQGPSGGVQAGDQTPPLAGMELGVTPASLSWRTVELTDDLTVLAAELRTHGERQTRMIRTQAAQIAQLTHALQAASLERDHFQRLYQEQRGSQPVATAELGEVTEPIQ